MYISEDGTYANVGEYNTSTLDFTQYGEIVYDDEIASGNVYAILNILGFEHNVVFDTWSYCLVNNYDYVMLIEYDSNNEPVRRLCQKTTL